MHCLLYTLSVGYVPGATHFAKHAFPRAHARSSELAAMSSSELAACYPHKTMTPLEVVDLQLEALQHGNSGLQVYWRFCSPEAKRATGVLRPGRRPYLTRPDYQQMPLYAPLLKSVDYRVVGALPISAKQYKCRVRVWPAGGDRECAGEPIPLSPVEYIWHLTQQPLVRPVCYEGMALRFESPCSNPRCPLPRSLLAALSSSCACAACSVSHRVFDLSGISPGSADDPMQQGISTGPPFAGCWLVDEVKRDDRWGRGPDDESRVGPNGDGGVSEKLGATPSKAPKPALALAR